MEESVAILNSLYTTKTYLLSLSWVFHSSNEVRSKDEMNTHTYTNNIANYAFVVVNVVTAC